MDRAISESIASAQSRDGKPQEDACVAGASLMMRLPETVLRRHLLPCLDARDLTRLACVNKELRALSNDPVLWRNLYVQDFFAPLCAEECRGFWERLRNVLAPRQSLPLRTLSSESRLVRELSQSVSRDDLERTSVVASQLAHQRESDPELAERRRRRLPRTGHGRSTPGFDFASEEEFISTSELRFNAKPKNTFHLIYIRLRVDLGRKEAIAMTPMSHLRGSNTLQLSAKYMYIARALQMKQRSNDRALILATQEYNRKVSALRLRIMVALDVFANLSSQSAVLFACSTAFLWLLSVYLLPESSTQAISLMIPWWIFLAYMLMCLALELVILAYYSPNSDGTMLSNLLHTQWNAHDSIYCRYMWGSINSVTYSLKANPLPTACYLLGLGGLLAFTITLPLKLEGSLQEASWALVFTPLYVFCLSGVLTACVPRGRESLKERFAEFLLFEVIIVLPVTLQVVFATLRCLGFLTSNFALVLIPGYVIQAVVGFICTLVAMESVDDFAVYYRTLFLYLVVGLVLFSPLVASQVLLVLYVNDATKGEPQRFTSTTVFAPGIAWFGVATLGLLGRRIAGCFSSSDDEEWRGTPTNRYRMELPLSIRD